MKFSTFAIKVWRAFSMLAVFGVVVYSYSLFSEDVGVHFDQTGKADEFVLKSTVFYIALGFIIANNVLLLYLGKRLAKLPSHLLPIPNANVWSMYPDELSAHLLNWVYALVAMINTLISMSIFALATVNNAFQYKIADFEGLLYIAVISLIIILVALPIRLMIAPKGDES